MPFVGTMDDDTGGVMENVTLSISGMSCRHCVARVTTALAALPGVAVGEVLVGSARVALDPSGPSLQVIGKALEDLGFRLETAAEPREANL